MDVSFPGMSQTVHRKLCCATQHAVTLYRQDLPNKSLTPQVCGVAIECRTRGVTFNAGSSLESFLPKRCGSAQLH
jgi:hypothetical protein